MAFQLCNACYLSWKNRLIIEMLFINQVVQVSTVNPGEIP